MIMAVTLAMRVIMMMIVPAAANAMVMRVIVRMFVSAAAAFVVRVIMAAATLRMIMMMVVIVSAAASFLVSMVVSAGAVIVVVITATMFVIVIMVMIMPAAIRCLVADGGQIENAQHQQPDASDQSHRAEDAIRRQVVNETSADVEVEHHAAPQQQQRDTDQMIDDTLRAHGLELAKD